jgi:hypothetical protein
MKRFIAGMILLVMILLGAENVHCNVYAATANTEVIAEDTYENENSAGQPDAVSDTSASDETEEDAEVLGAQRDENNKFVICVEVAICLIFAIGLIAAGKSGYEN